MSKLVLWLRGPTPQWRRNHQEAVPALSIYQIFSYSTINQCGLTILAEEAFAETHAQTQEEDRNHAAHRQEDDHGRTHCHTQAQTPIKHEKQTKRSTNGGQREGLESSHYQS